MIRPLTDAPSIKLIERANRYNRWHPFWDLQDFEERAAWREPEYGMSPAARRRRYPTRAIRYWLAAQLMRREILRRPTPLRVLEVGVDSGQMLGFLGARLDVPENPLPPGVFRWDAITLKPDRPRLARLGYQDVHEHNLEQLPLPISRRYDIILLSHVLEHLRRPEETVEALVNHLTKGGLMVGGFPSVPDFARGIRQRQLDAGAGKHGHVSKFSPRRTREMARRAGLSVELLTGAFAVRAKGAWVESSRFWLRWNLMMGALFPSWPGEVYFQFRKLS